MNDEIHEEADQGGAFFVLSSGWCGTEVLARVLGSAQNASVWHPLLSKEIVKEDRGSEADDWESFWNSRKYRVYDAWSRGFVYGETASEATPYCHDIAKTIPSSRFLILLSDPRRFVFRASSGNNLDPFRHWAGPKRGHEEFVRFMGLTGAERLCWLWDRAYREILRMAEDLPAERVMIARFEDLVSKRDRLKAVFRFLGLEGFDPEKTRMPPAVDKAGQSLSRQIDAMNLWEICGEMAERYGYRLNGNGHRYHTLHPAKEVPRLCVGMPIYSGGRFLKEAIASILSQNFGDLELIVSDHGGDPDVAETCRLFARKDPRLVYVPTEDHQDYLGIRNIQRMIELCRSPYFMWGAYDDVYDADFIDKCMKAIEKDQGIALVYPHSRVLDGDAVRFDTDVLKADMESPWDRFLSVISQLGLCNAFYGIFRTSALRKTHALQTKVYRAADNLLLADIALQGKIIQLPEILFERRLTRPYRLPADLRNADVIRSHDIRYVQEGITLPYCRLTYAHLELIQYSELPKKLKAILSKHVVEIFRRRWDQMLRFEIQRAIDLVRQGIFYLRWDRKTYVEGGGGNSLTDRFHATDLLKHLEEALFIYPEWRELEGIIINLHDFLRNSAACTSAV